jgi:tetratricopeptide (TPR) repeat protein
MDLSAEIKALILGRDTKGIRDLFFKPGSPELQAGFFREDQWWDYKEDCPESGKATDLEWARIAADVAAFHNQEGGILFFGIRNRDFRFMGARPRLDTKLFNDKIRKYVGDRFWVSFSREFIQSDQTYLGVAVVPPRSVTQVRMLRDGPMLEGKPIFQAGDLCVRVGDETKTFRGSEAIRFAATRGLGVSAATFAVDEPNFKILRPDYKRFVRREALCETIDKAIRSDRTYVTSLTGIGGIGKTALACWMTLQSYEHKEFDFIVSVSARDRALTGTGIIPVSPTFSSLADLLRLLCETTGFGEIAEMESEDERLRQVKSDILSQFRGLLFVDNLETVDDPRILAFLEDLPIPTKAIVTSRKAKVRIANFPIEVGPFDKNEAIRFLEETARTVGKEFIVHMTGAEKEGLVNSCDRIPLVIEWLIGHSRDQGRAIKIAEGLEAHGKHGEELLEFSFRRVFDEMTGSQRLICQAVSLMNRPLPIEAIAVASNLPLHTASDVLEELQDYSLVERVYDSNYRDLVYTLLPVTSTFLYRELRKSPGLESEIRKRLGDWYQARDVADAVQREQVQRVRRGEQNPELTLLQIARNYEASGDLDNAENFYKQALERNPRSWQCHRELAEFFRHRRDETSRCLTHYKQACEVAPKQGPARAKIFREYGIVLRSSGLASGPREAAEALEEALRQTPGDPVCRHALGDCYVKMMFYEKAIQVLEPLLGSPYQTTRVKTYPLLEVCYKGTDRTFELLTLKERMVQDKY